MIKVTFTVICDTNARVLGNKGAASKNCHIKFYFVWTLSIAILIFHSYLCKKVWAPYSHFSAITRLQIVIILHFLFSFLRGFYSWDFFLTFFSHLHVFEFFNFSHCVSLFDPFVSTFFRLFYEECNIMFLWKIYKFIFFFHYFTLHFFTLISHYSHIFQIRIFQHIFFPIKNSVVSKKIECFNI